MTTKKTIKSALESMMFTWGEPLDAKDAADVFNMDWKEVYDLFIELQEEYQQEGRGIEIRRIEKSFQFVTKAENYEYIEKLCTPVKKKKLSQSALEVLAIVAYKQPVTRGEVEAIRGIKCERVLEGLEKKDLIKEVGRSNGLGRPILYGTTEQFLQYMNISSIDQLPQLEDMENGTESFQVEESLEMNQISMDSLTDIAHGTEE
ncbi:MAG: SMC-Scp complex subunit ScpB [Eubacterium sp.]|jgi:segregation and condensation protein B|nr:SMC-Scp complex subunit ScpB [Eubacterium sp.]